VGGLLDGLTDDKNVNTEIERAHALGKRGSFFLKCILKSEIYELLFLQLRVRLWNWLNICLAKFWSWILKKIRKNFCEKGYWFLRASPQSFAVTVA
jgi:hypothetical protein